jgi:hypothetical protein
MVIDEINELLATPRPEEAKPFLERLDATLTAGYAQALQLEAERWRLERKLGEVAARLADEGTQPPVDELLTLARRLTAANEGLTSLRALLTSLRERRAEVRTAA